MVISDKIWSVLIMCLGILAACALLPGSGDGANPVAITDAYLIAHGMARSYNDRPEADPAVAAQLARLDAEAGQAVEALTSARGGDAAASARAVAALTDFAARHTATER